MLQSTSLCNTHARTYVWQALRQQHITRLSGAGCLLAAMYKFFNTLSETPKSHIFIPNKKRWDSNIRLPLCNIFSSCTIKTTPWIKLQSTDEMSLKEIITFIITFRNCSYSRDVAACATGGTLMSERQVRVCRNGRRQWVPETSLGAERDDTSFRIEQWQ